MVSPLQPLGGGINSDLESLLDDARRRREERIAREQARTALSALPDLQLDQFDRQRQAQAALEAANAPPQEQESFLSRVASILDLPAKHVARPAMGAVLANAFRVLPGEQEGEAALREAVGANPFAAFVPGRAEQVREALKETDLPFGVHTAMEIALDPLTYVPVGLLSKGAKFGVKGALALDSPAAGQVAKRVGRLIPLNERVDLVMTENQMRRVGERLNRVPLVRNLVGTVNPTSASKTPLGRRLIGYNQLLEDSEGLTAVAVSHLAGRRMPFQIVNGEAVLQSGRRVAWGDIFSRPKAFARELTEEQRRYIDDYAEVVREGKQYLDDLRIKIPELTLGPDENYIPRFVLGKDGLEKFAGGTPTTGKRIGLRQSFQNQRYYDTMAEGLEAGVSYLNDPVAALTQHMRGIYRTVADDMLLQEVRPLGVTVGERIPTYLKVKVQAARAARTQADNAEKLIERAKRGEAIPEASIRAVQRAHPNIGVALREALEAERRVTLPAARGATPHELTFRATKAKQAQLDGLLERVRGVKAKASDDAQSVLNEYKRARQIAARPRFDEAFIGQPGLSGRIFPKDVADEMARAFAPRGDAFIRAMGNANAAARLGLTGFDFGAGMIQGLPLLATRPAAWVRAQTAALRSLFDPDALSRYINTHSTTIQEMARHGGVVNVDEFVESILAGGGLERALQAGGKATSPIRFATKRAAAAFTTFGTAARVELYEAMKPMARRAGLKKGLSEAQILEQLTETVGKMTGVGGKARLGIQGTRAEVERALLFAPRYLRASLGLVADTVQGGLRGELARNSMAKMLGGGLLMYYGWATALGQEPKLDPRRSDFLTVDLAGQRVGFGSIWTTLARTTAGVYSQVERGDANDIVSIDPERSILARFTRFRASPILGLGWDVARGRDAIGAPVGNPIEQPLEFVGDLPRYIAPFWAQQFIEDDSPIEGDEFFGVSFPAEIAGFRAFPTNIFAQRRERQDTLAMAAFNKPWDELTGLQRKGLEEGDPLLKQYLAQIRSWQLERGDDLDRAKAEFFEKQDQFQRENQNAVKMASDQWRAGRSSGSEWRERILNAGQKQRALMAELNGPQSIYQPVIEELKNVRNTDNRTPVEDLAYDEYIQRVVIGGVENEKELHNVFGEVDFEERDRRVESIRVRYGEEIYRNIQVRLSLGHENDPLLNEWREGLELFRSYWEAGDVLAKRASLMEPWQEYKRFAGTARADQIAEQFPALKDIDRQVTKIRQAMRQDSPALEAYLLKFGYVSSIRNRTLSRLGQAAVEKADFDVLALPLT